MNITTLIFLSLVGSGAIASESSKIKIWGVVKSFDETYVVLEQNHHKFRISRTAFEKNLLPGKKVTIEIDRKEVFKEK